MRAAHLGALAGPLLALLAGCHDPITEVLLVVTSDLVIPSDVDLASIVAFPGRLFPGTSFTVPVSQFPISMGVQASQTEVFSARIQFFRSPNLNTLVVSRNVTGVRFVHGELRMVVVPMKRACACQGTSCPLPGTSPDCDDLESPQTVPLDPKVAPPPGGASPGGVVLAAESGAPFGR